MRLRKIRTAVAQSGEGGVERAPCLNRPAPENRPMNALREQLMLEIQHIPENRLREIFDVIHFFRLGLDSVQVDNMLNARSGSITKSAKGIKLGGLADKEYCIPDDFNKPLADLAEYM
jgi:hypothetical protein